MIHTYDPLRHFFMPMFVILWIPFFIITSHNVWLSAHGQNMWNGKAIAAFLGLVVESFSIICTRYHIRHG